MNRSSWLKKRQKGIGGSDAASVYGISKYKSNETLWKEKCGLLTPEDISEKPAVIYGKAAEPILRNLFTLHHPEFIIEYDEFGMIANNPDLPFAFATLDGTLHDMDGIPGILEIKTAELNNAAAWGEWRNQVPDGYYVQILHQFLATGYTYAYLFAELRGEIGGEIKYYYREYFFERKNCEGDIELLKQAEIKFWDCVANKRKPDLILPEV